MSNRDYRLSLNDIRESCTKILDYTRECSYDDFRFTPMLVDAVIRNLEIIGEATRNLPAAFRKKHPQIEWKKIIALRNIVIHEYFGLDYEILWDVVQHKVPELLSNIKDVT